MLAIIKWIIISLFNLLPDSPFSQMLDSMEVDSSYLQYMNWFLPFDYIGYIMLAWIDCILAYIAFLLIRRIVFNFILGKIIAVGTAGGMGGGA